MRRRLIKYLRRILIVVVLLGLLGVGVFTWLCYWPLEGSVDDVLALVPEQVEFVLRGKYEDLEATGWVQENALDNPLHPALAEKAGDALAEARAQIADIERQINDSIPVDLELTRFGVLDDVARGEFIAAGNFCAEQGPGRGPPSWQEILVFTRVSWKTRCVAALKHGFIRDQLGPNLEVYAQDDDIFRLVFRNMRVSPRHLREGCGRGFTRPPENEWYLRRVKDVIALSNSENLIKKVAGLAKSGEPQGSFAGRPGFDLRPVPGRIVAAINIEPLYRYFTRVFERWPELLPLRRFLRPAALEKLNGYLSLEGRDLLTGSAEISYIPARVETIQQSVYSLAERPVRAGIATLVPAQDTFAVLSLRSDPYYLLQAIMEEVLTPGDRRLWEDNLRKYGEFESLDEFFKDLSTRIGDQAMVAAARLSSIYDEIEYPEWYSGGEDPMPAFAVMVRIKEGGNQNELDAYLSSKVPLLGFSEKLDRIKYRGYEYSRTVLEQKLKDYKHVQPCFILAQDHLILTTNETYMRQILDTVQDPDVPSLATDVTFQQAMAPLPERGHVGFFLDLEKIGRIPPSTDVEDGGPPGSRGFRWDLRNKWVIQNKDDWTEARRFRSEERKKYPARISRQQQDALEDAVDAHMETWRSLYAQFVDEYRTELEGFRRFRGLGLVLGASRDTIGTHFSLVFRDAEDWVSWAR